MTVDPLNNYYAAADFLDKVNDAYLIVGALDHFGMETVEDELKKNLYSGMQIDVNAKREYVTKTIRQFVERHMVNQVPELSPEAPTSNDLRCRECGRRYLRPHALRNHEREKHGIIPPRNSTSISHAGEDHIHNYTHQLLVLLLLRANRNDAIKLGDGERVIRLYKYFVVFQDFQMPKICLCNAASPSTSKLFADSEDELFSHLEQVREPSRCN